jgi:hypothetical protein
MAAFSATHPTTIVNSVVAASCSCRSLQLTMYKKQQQQHYKSLMDLLQEMPPRTAGTRMLLRLGLSIVIDCELSQQQKRLLLLLVPTSALWEFVSIGSHKTG